jgi:hypothetical protein
MESRLVMRGRVFAGALFCAAAFLLPPASAEETNMPSPAAAVILRLEGKVEVKEPGGTDWGTAEQDAWIKKGTEIKTGPASGCDIGFGENRLSVIRLMANTRVTLRTMDAEKIRVNLDEGRVLAKVRDLQADATFELASLSLVATAQTAGWEQSLDEVSVFENSIDTAPSGGQPMLVEEGFGVAVDSAGILKELKVLSPEEKAEWAESGMQTDTPAYEEIADPEEEAVTPEEEIMVPTENISGITNAGYAVPATAGQMDSGEYGRPEENMPAIMTPEMPSQTPVPSWDPFTASQVLMGASPEWNAGGPMTSSPASTDIMGPTGDQRADSSGDPGIGPGNPVENSYSGPADGGASSE